MNAMRLRTAVSRLQRAPSFSRQLGGDFVVSTPRGAPSFATAASGSSLASKRTGPRSDVVDVVGHRNEQGDAITRSSQAELEQRSPMSVFNATELAYGMFHIHDAGVGDTAKPLLQGIADEAITRLWQFQADDLAQMTYCLYAANVQYQDWYRAVARELTGRMEEMLAAEIASTVLILARENVHDRGFIDAVAKRATPVIGKRFERQIEFTGRQLSMVAEAFNTLQETNSSLGAAMAKTVEQFPAMFTPKELNPVVSFIASSGEGNPNFHEVVNKHETLYEESIHWKTKRDEDHDPTNIIYTMHVPDAHGAPHRLKPRKFVQGEQ